MIQTITNQSSSSAISGQSSHQNLPRTANFETQSRGVQQSHPQSSLNGFQQFPTSTSQPSHFIQQQVMQSDHVNQLKQLHQRLLQQQYQKQQQQQQQAFSVSHNSISSSFPVSQNQSSSAAGGAKQTVESCQINQKLLQLKQQLEQSKAVTSGPSQLQMKLQQHIMTQQAKKSPKSQKQSPKQKREQKKGYTSGSDSSSVASQSQKSASTIGKRSYQETSAASSEHPKYQMYDHTTEQKKRRLQLASFHKNDLFHTSGNRFIPTMPKSILGASSSSQKSVTKSI